MMIGQQCSFNGYIRPPLYLRLAPTETELDLNLSKSSSTASQEAQSSQYVLLLALFVPVGTCINCNTFVSLGMDNISGSVHTTLKVTHQKKKKKKNQRSM